MHIINYNHTQAQPGFAVGLHTGYHTQGRSSQKFVSEGDNTGGLGTEVPSGVQGQSPGGGLGAKPPEAEDKLETIAKMC